MMVRFKGYSLLEIILVTTFIIIFIVVINPGTYIDRFSKILLKMNVLGESELVFHKFNVMSNGSCLPQSVSSSEFSFLTNEGTFSFKIESDQLVLNNLGSGSEAVLYRYMDATLLNEFSYYNSYLFQTYLPNDVKYIDLTLYSSLLDHEVIGSMVCHDQHIILGAYE